MKPPGTISIRVRTQTGLDLQYVPSSGMVAQAFGELEVVDGAWGTVVVTGTGCSGYFSG